MQNTSPSKTEISLLEPFTGLPLEKIYVPSVQSEFATATEELLAAGVVGFDTESKPTFKVGDVSTGPHLVQFSLPDKAYLFRLHHAEGDPFLIELLQSANLIKAGFGLKSDGKHIFAKLGIRMNGVVDLNRVFSMRGYQKEMGVRNAVGLVFKQRFVKSRKVTTSNWAQAQLTPQQMLYAANDAYAALKVLEALNISREDLCSVVMQSQPILQD